jgi:formate dehydrogenase iron-sulfur subunit
MTKKPSLSGFLGDGPALIGAYLEEQQNLTAVDRFSSLHDRVHGLEGNPPRLESHYRDLLPLAKPIPGQQYAFEVDLDRCTGCKACVTACHNLNGLDEEETWRSVGLIHNVMGKPLQQTVTTACQHCLEPACSHGCPVKAYEKDPVTGIVKHLDDQCIGCEYCILKCPYDVPQYHKGKGIVRKCDMCVGRLEVGEAPACVQSCPTKAISITLVEQSEVRKNPTHYTALPGSPDPKYTFPTTRYKTSRKFPESMEAADAYKVRKEKAHLPLVFMLTISQMAAGFLITFEAGSLSGLFPANAVFQALGHIVGASLMALAIVVSIFHLGRPLYAFRAVLGFRRSWLSREIVAFGILGGLASAAALGSWLQTLQLNLSSMNAFVLNTTSDAPMRWSLILFSLVAVHCSAMVYRDTPRIYWASRLTSAKFMLSGTLTGLASTLVLLTGFFSFNPKLAPTHLPSQITVLCIALGLSFIGKLACEARIQRHIDDQDANPLKKAALLLRGELRFIHGWRFNLGLLGGLVLPVLFLYRGFTGLGSFDFMMSICILTALLAGECLERYLFFTACVPPRMPGA